MPSFLLVLVVGGNVFEHTRYQEKNPRLNIPKLQMYRREQRVGLTKTDKTYQSDHASNDFNY